jgi:glutamate-ammonia-ligase adenylyltransferase
LIDVEYTVQYLQLLHGAVAPTVRTPNTLAAIQALHNAAYLNRQEYQQLSAAYVFLRHLIDALRIVRGHARDLVLPPIDSEEFIFLARRLSYWGDANPPSRLAADIAHHMRQAAHIYHARFVTPATLPPPNSV